MTNKDNYQKVGVEVDQQSFAQLQQKANDAATSMARLSQVNSQIADSATQAGSRLQQAFRSVKYDVEGDTNSLQSLRAQLKGAADDAESLNRVSQSGSGGSGFGVEGLRRTGGALNQLLPDSEIGPAVQRLGDLGQIVKELGPASEAAGVALGPVTVALAGIALIAATFQRTIDDASKGLSEAVAKTDAYYKAIETGTTESLKNELAALQVHQKIEEQKQRDLQAAYIAAHPGDVPDDPNARHDFFSDLSKVFSGAVSDLSKGGKELNKDLEDTTAEINRTKAQIDALKEALKSGAVAANDDKVAHDALHKTIGEFADTGAKAAQKELDDLNKAVRDAQKLRDETAQKEVDSIHKYNDAVQAANDTADQAKLAAAQKLNDALVNAAQAAVDASSKAIETLQQKQADNLTGLNRDLDKLDREAADKQLTDQIAAQKQERDDLQAHLEAIKQIRDRDKGRERDDLLNRNYRDLFALKEQQNQDISSENDKYSKQEKARQEALKQQQSDDTRALQIQRRERLIAYQQANADAVKAYNIELAHAQEAKARAIQLAQQGYQKELAAIAKNNTDKLAALRASEIAELKIITQSTQARQKIFLDELNQARQMLGQATSGQSGAFNSPQNIAQDTGFAYGGDPNYQRVKVNDGGRGQRESFNGVLLPRGLGLFIPMTSGRIDANGGAGGGVNYNPTFNITGPDPKTIADMIDARNMRFAKETFLK